jgi:hypothetical protein
MTLTFSRRMAIAAGLVLPVVETLRRWRQLGDIRVWPFWLDDWAIGLFLLYAAWRVGKDPVGSRPFLAAAWGFALGMVYASFFSQLTAVDRPDPSGISSVVVVGIKGVMFILTVVALIGTLRARQ